MDNDHPLTATTCRYYTLNPSFNDGHYFCIPLFVVHEMDFILIWNKLDCIVPVKKWGKWQKRLDGKIDCQEFVKLQKYNDLKFECHSSFFSSRNKVISWNATNEHSWPFWEGGRGVMGKTPLAKRVNKTK